jgi:hypothetical protein
VRTHRQRRVLLQFRARSHLLRSLALRGGKNWALPPALREMKDRLCAKCGGDRQFMTTLATIAEDGTEAVSVACELALEANAISDAYVLNALSRFKPQPSAEVVEAPKRLKLKKEPKADVARYDVLLKKLAMAAIAAMPMLVVAMSNCARSTQLKLVEPRGIERPTSSLRIRCSPI